MGNADPRRCKRMIILDTDFLVELMLGEPNAVAKAKELEERGGFVTTIINVEEVYHLINLAYASPYINDKTRRDFLIKKANSLFNNLSILSLDKNRLPKMIDTDEMFSLEKQGNSSDTHIAQIALRQIAEKIVTNTKAFNELEKYIEIENY
jgi:predicted nucleic acid-binding protein